MNILYGVLYASVALVLVGGLVYSIRIRGRIKSEIDQGVSQRIKDNPTALNPMIWAYVLFAGLILLMVWIFKLYYGAPL